MKNKTVNTSLYKLDIYVNKIESFLKVVSFRIIEIVSIKSEIVELQITLTTIYNHLKYNWCLIELINVQKIRKCRSFKARIIKENHRFNYLKNKYKCLIQNSAEQNLQKHTAIRLFFE